MVTKRLTNGDDFFTAGKSNDVIYGLEGWDRIYGGGGNDTIRGGSGLDQIYGDAGADKLYGDDQDDNIHGGGDNDLIDGGSGDDQIFGDKGDDRLLGGDGDDSIRDTNGRDYLDGGKGDDNLFAEDGKADTLYGRDGNDTLILTNGTAFGGNGDDDLQVRGANGIPATHVVLTGGAGLDNFLVGMNTGNGRADVVEIADASQTDGDTHTVHITFNVSTYLITETFQQHLFTREQVGEDLVFTMAGGDGDKLIVRDAADWFHL